MLIELCLLLATSIFSIAIFEAYSGEIYEKDEKK
jgi:hypothetical protein